MGFIKQYSYSNESGTDFSLSGVIELNNGEILLFGRQTSSSNQQLASISRLDANGEQLWSKTIGFDKDTYLRGGIKINENEFIFYGTIRTEQTNENPIILKIDLSGNIIWLKELSILINYSATSLEVIKTENDFVIYGNSIKDRRGNVIVKFDTDGVLKAYNYNIPIRILDGDYDALTKELILIEQESFSVVEGFIKAFSLIKLDNNLKITSRRVFKLPISNYPGTRVTASVGSFFKIKAILKDEYLIVGTQGLNFQNSEVSRKEYTLKIPKSEINVSTTKSLRNDYDYGGGITKRVFFYSGFKLEDNFYNFWNDTNDKNLLYIDKYDLDLNILWSKTIKQKTSQNSRLSFLQGGFFKNTMYLTNFSSRQGILSIVDSELNPDACHTITTLPSRARNAEEVVFTVEEGATYPNKTLQITLTNKTSTVKNTVLEEEVLCPLSIPPSITTSTITAAPTRIEANSTSQSVITVQLKDDSGTNITTGGETIAMTTSKGMLSAVTDNNNGTYTATLTSSSQKEDALISFKINNVNANNTTTVTFFKVVNITLSTISASPVNVEANGTTKSIVTVQLKDNQGVNLSIGGEVITILSSIGNITNVVDNNNGTYTAELTSNRAGSAKLTFTVNGATSPQFTTVGFYNTLGCSVDFTIQVNQSVIAAEGRYKPQRDMYGSWVVFDINDIAAASTPVLNAPGYYDLEVRVQGANETWTEWFPCDPFVIDCESKITPGVLVEVGVGGCFSEVGRWESLYVLAEDNVGELNNGQVLYSDNSLKNPYNGGGRTFRFRGSSSSSAARTSPYSFKINQLGVVFDKQFCVS